MARGEGQEAEDFWDGLDAWLRARGCSGNSFQLSIVEPTLPEGLLAAQASRSPKGVNG